MWAWLRVKRCCGLGWMEGIPMLTWGLVGRLRVWLPKWLSRRFWTWMWARMQQRLVRILPCSAKRSISLPIPEMRNHRLRNFVPGLCFLNRCFAAWGQFWLPCSGTIYFATLLDWHHFDFTPNFSNQSITQWVMKVSCIEFSMAWLTSTTITY